MCSGQRVKYFANTRTATLKNSRQSVEPDTENTQSTFIELSFKDSEGTCENFEVEPPDLS